MKLIIESNNISDYLMEISPVIEFGGSVIQKTIAEIHSKASSKEEKARRAFEIARDEIRHSFDIKGLKVPISAEETLRNKEGICFAKAHLLTTLLRAMEIPAGFCYQRVFKNGKNKDDGFALHGLNAIYLEKYGWFRVDPRGNKEGIDSQFSIETEKLAYPIRKNQGEVDYPNVFSKPLESVIHAMENSVDCKVLFNNRPDKI